MTITSTLFLFLFLPVSLAVYHLAGNRQKEYVLLAFSMLFYACADLWNLVFIVLAMTVTIFLGRRIASSGTSAPVKKILMTCGIIFAGGGYYSINIPSLSCA